MLQDLSPEDLSSMLLKLTLENNSLIRSLCARIGVLEADLYDLHISLVKDRPTEEEKESQANLIRANLNCFESDAEVNEMAAIDRLQRICPELSYELLVCQPGDYRISE